MTIYIFGEAHQSTKNVAYINRRITEIKPKFILHELLYSDVALTPSVIKERLDKCKRGGVCDPRLNKDIYELGLSIGAGLVGIDTHVKDTDLKRSFQKREAFMLDKIRQYMSSGGDVVVVVGDIHLREQYSHTLGEPSVLNQLADKAVIERAPKELREAK